MTSHRHAGAWNLFVVGSLLVCSGSAFTFLPNPRSARSTSVTFRPDVVVQQCRQKREKMVARVVVPIFESKGDSFVEADDIAAIQKLFNKYCDEDGLMTKASLIETPPFSEMLVRHILPFSSRHCQPRKNFIQCSRITPRQCRRKVERGQQSKEIDIERISSGS